MFEHLHSSRSKMEKMGFTISDLLNNFDFEFWLVKSLLRECANILILTGFTVLHYNIYNSYYNI